LFFATISVAANIFEFMVGYRETPAEQILQPAR
jgi:hypothetical protein